uniref:rho guanine nucleotide exchange factor 1 n=1 Tax=Lonchura striata TaxID=40157 RepID=UPI0012940727|nr:rho guanine nucleotide exchange factor 1 [Lonchura striata domestica]
MGGYGAGGVMPGTPRWRGGRQRPDGLVLGGGGGGGGGAGGGRGPPGGAQSGRGAPGPGGGGPERPGAAGAAALRHAPLPGPGWGGGGRRPRRYRAASFLGFPCFLSVDFGVPLPPQFEGTEGSWFQKISARFCSRQSFALEQLKAKQRKDTRFSQFIQVPETPKTSPKPDKNTLKHPKNILKYPKTPRNTLKHRHPKVPLEPPKSPKIAPIPRNSPQKLKDYQRRLDLSGVKQSSDPLLNEFKVGGARDPQIHPQILPSFTPKTSRATRARGAAEVQVLLLDDLLVLLQRQEERLLLRCHSRALAPAPDGKRLLSPVIRLRCAMTRQVATDHKAFYVIASWEDGAQIYELVAPSVADRKT